MKLNWDLVDPIALMGDLKEGCTGIMPWQWSPTRLLNIQRRQSIKPSGREYHLITLIGLREAGERHHDLNGGDPDVSAKAAGHSKEMKARYYKKVSYEEALESFGRYHPAFVKG